MNENLDRLYKGARSFIAAFAFASVAASAQDLPEGALWGPRINVAAVAFDSDAIWRGFHLGNRAGVLDLDLALYGYPITGVSTDTDPRLSDYGAELRLRGNVMDERKPRAPVGARAEAVLALSKHALRGGSTYVEFLASVYQNFDGKPNEGGGEVGIGFGGLGFKPLPEYTLWIDGKVLRDVGRFDAFHAEVGARYNFRRLFQRQPGLTFSIAARAFANGYGNDGFEVRGVRGRVLFDWQVYVMERWRRSLSLVGHISRDRIRNAEDVTWGGLTLKLE